MNLKKNHSNEDQEVQNSNLPNSFSRRKMIQFFGALFSGFMFPFLYASRSKAGGFIPFSFIKKLTKTADTEAFFINVFTGTGGALTITNGLNFVDTGGAIWSATRTGTEGNGPEIINTVRGGNKRLLTASTAGEYTILDPVTFNNNGFSMTTTANSYINYSGFNKVVWSFLKKPKFFDILTWTGTGTTATLNHSLGILPGVIIIKATTTDSFTDGNNWMYWHRSMPGPTSQSASTNWPNACTLNTTSTYGSYNGWLTVTSTQITPTYHKTNGITYIAYVFAHDPSADGIIKCGSYLGTGTGTPPNVVLDWEPQFIMIKNITSTTNWEIFDSMRGLTVSNNNGSIGPNLAGTEFTNEPRMHVMSNGFYPDNTTSAYENTTGNYYVYMAIRRSLKSPTSGSQVFGICYHPPSTRVDTGILTDLLLFKAHTYAPGESWFVYDRVRGGSKRLLMNTTDTEASGYLPTYLNFDFAYQSGVNNVGSGFSANIYMGWGFKRAPGVFDIVCYSGTGSALTIPHNLKALPELIIVKSRNTTMSWRVSLPFIIGLSNVGYLNSNSHMMGVNGSEYTQLPTDTNFYPGGVGSGVGTSGENYVAYLFASKAGISKIGSYSGSAVGDVSVDCGFASPGPRFVLLKRYDLAGGDWLVIDSTRGSTVYSILNSTSAETTATVITFSYTGFVAKASTVANPGAGANFIFIAFA